MRLTRLDFYPRSPCGERRCTQASHARGCIISIHALLAESDCAQKIGKNGITISIHALLAESDILGNPCAGCPAISIHALLAESDQALRLYKPPDLNFYPRSPCGERPHAQYHAPKRAKFLSTLSLRRATQRQIEFERYSDISIHALLAESDQRACVKIPASAKFLSTLSLRRATWTHWPSRWSHSYFYPRSPCGERLLATRVPHPPR